MPPRQANRVRCDDWRDWGAQPAQHSPFHYWRWDDTDIQRSESRLGQRTYTTACLLWAAMHDAGLGKRLAFEHPNWSAISSYYSMVHSLRLAWFVLYGGYPTGHAEMARPLQGAGPARPDWAHGDMQPTEANIYQDALLGAVRDGLRASELADELPVIGRLFEVSRKLREDANYESLLLAHQYFHRSMQPQQLTDVDVTHEFTGARDALATAAAQVHAFAGRFVLTAFQDEAEWFAPRRRFTGGSLLRFVVGDINALIEYGSAASRPLREFDWWEGPFRHIECQAATSEVSVESVLGQHRLFDSFYIKRTVMQQFRDKVSDLRNQLHEGLQCP